jgi:hypothetical protein
LDSGKLLAACLAGTQGIQAHPGHDGGQPAAQVVHPGAAGPAHPQPGFLHGVVGVGGRAEHPVGHRPQVGAVLFKAPASQSSSIGHIFRSRSVITATNATTAM